MERWIIGALLVVGGAAACGSGSEVEDVEPLGGVVVEAEFVTDDAGTEFLELRITAPAEPTVVDSPLDPVSYTLRGPGEGHRCGGLVLGGACRWPLAGLEERRLTIEVKGESRVRGSRPDRWIDRVDETVGVELPWEMYWSEEEQVTRLRGLPGRLQLDANGDLELVDGPPNATLFLGERSHEPPATHVALDLGAVADAQGLDEALRATGAISVPDVRVRLQTGSAVEGVARIDGARFRARLVRYLAGETQGESPAPTGEAVAWFVDDTLHELRGTATAVGHLRAVVLQRSAQTEAGECRFIAGVTGGVTIVPRHRETITIWRYDRQAGERVAERSFEGPVATCPTTWSAGQRVHGPSDAETRADAEAYARQLFEG